MIKWNQQNDAIAHAKGLGRGMLLAASVGVAAGIGAIVFQMLTHMVSFTGLSWLAGYQQGIPDGEHTLFVGPSGPLRLWMLILLPTVGGLISGFLIFRYAPEAEGHGTDAAIDAYHNKRGQIRGRVPLIKMLTAAITMGTGGSGGREGPIAQIGAGFGSFLGSRLNLSDKERRVLMAAGVGAGIGAIFQAPLAGAIFASEVLYRDPDLEAETLIPAIMATTVAYCVFNFGMYWILTWLGYPSVSAFEPLFMLHGNTRLGNPIVLIPITVLAMVMTLASWLYVKTFYGIHGAFKRLRVPAMIKPAIGALLTGVIAVIAYLSIATLGTVAQHGSLNVLSYGYGVLQDIFTGADPRADNWIAHSPTSTVMIVLLVIGIGKILTTSLTIGSGGSGGVFGPSMVIGGALGAFVGLVFKQLMPGLEIRIDVFAILGMASFFAAAANTPISTLLIVSEMTSSYSLLLPTMWVCAFSYIIARRWSIFTEQVPTRRESPAHRGDFIIDILQDLSVRDSFRESAQTFLSAPLNMPLRDMGRLITESRQASFPVIDAHGDYYGLFGLDDIRQFLYHADNLADLAVAEDLATTGCEPLTLQMSLSDAIGRFAQWNFAELPVVDENCPKTVIGLLRRQDLIATYDAQLLRARRDWK